MTVTVTRRVVVGDDPFTDKAGNRKKVYATIAYDTGNYVTGGVAIAAADFGLTTLDGIDVIASSVHAGEYDHVAGKMLLRVKTTNAEVGSGAALTTASSIRVQAYGT